MTVSRQREDSRRQAAGGREQLEIARPTVFIGLRLENVAGLLKLIKNRQYFFDAKLADVRIDVIQWD
jgi:hypothetical protein